MAFKIGFSPSPARKPAASHYKEAAHMTAAAKISVYVTSVTLPSFFARSIPLRKAGLSLSVLPKYRRTAFAAELIALYQFLTAFGAEVLHFLLPRFRCIYDPD